MPQSLPSPQYNSWVCTRTRDSSNGLAAMPTAGPWPQIVQVVALHGGFEVETLSGVAVSVGAPPVIVSPNSLANNTNRLYLGGAQSGSIPVVTFGSVKLYGIAWAYNYCVLSPEGLDGDFKLGIQPWDSDGYTTEYLPSGNMNQFLINDSTSPPLNGKYDQLPALITQIEDER